MTRDPMRWSDPSSGASSAVRDLLGSIGVDEPTSTQLDRVTIGLAAKLGIPTMPTGAQSGSASVGSAATGGVSVGKLALVLGIVAVVATAIGGSLVGSSRARPIAPPAIALEQAEPAAATHVREVLTQPVELPPAPARPPIARPLAAPATKAPSTEPTPDGDEITILEAAQSSLASAPAAALAHAERHAARYVAGVLREEREAIAIEALIGLDRVAEARARFTRFVTAFPRSGYRARLARRFDQKTQPEPPLHP